MVQFCLLLVDLALIVLTFTSSFVLRYGWDIPDFSFAPYKDNFPFLTFLYILSLAFTRVFKNRFKSYWELFYRISNGMLTGTLLGFVFVYVFRIRWSSFPSSVFLIAFPVGIFIIFSVNAVLLRLCGKIKKKVLIIGKGNVKDILDDNDITENTYIEKIEDILKHENADEIVICELFHDDNQMNLLTFLLLKLKINVIFSPSLYTKLLSGSVMEENSLKFLATSLGRKSDLEEYMIRLLDVGGSFLMLLLFGPLMIIVWILVKLTSAGPAIYKQTRVTKDGGLFTLYKFRTMINDAEEHTGPVLASEDDGRITKVGAFLRQTRLDELPQLFNIIKGDMSLVGPRPERPHFVKMHKALREMRLAVKPGLTGFAQIRNLYDLHPRHKIKYDYLYIQRRSLLLNLYILFKTIPIIFSKKGR